MFKNRTEAGQKLAQRLLSYKDANPVVVALPRGGVPVGFEIASLLGAPLDVMVVRKLGFPGQPEVAIGAVADGDKWEVLLNKELLSHTELPNEYLEHEIASKLDEIHRMEDLFRNHRPAVHLPEQTVIVVDDGIATGATMRVIVKRLQNESPRKIVVATPVIAEDTLQLLRADKEQIVYLKAPEAFMSVGAFYFDFRAVSNEEVIDLLDRARDEIHKIPHSKGGE